MAADGGARVRVLFVCLGNICRSPTAEVVFARDVGAAGLAGRFELDSAGTGGWHAGQPAHPETRRTAAEHGLQITHRARRFDAEDFAHFDWLLAMDRENRSALLQLAPDSRARVKVHLFRSFDPHAPADAEVPDPYIGQDGFESVFAICERASAGLLAHLRRLHGF